MVPTLFTVNGERELIIDVDIVRQSVVYKCGHKMSGQTDTEMNAQKYIEYNPKNSTAARFLFVLTPYRREHSRHRH